MPNYQDYILPNILESSLIQKAISFFESRELIDLPLTEPFSDAGVYALYYFGDQEHYRPLSERNRNAKTLNEFFPIYVGKAVPTGSRTARTRTTGISLFKRIEEHTKSIQCASHFNIQDFKSRFVILQNNEVDLIVPLEAELIRRYAPIWNSCVAGFGIHHPGSGRYGQKKSEWDTLHPGRRFAENLTGRELDKKEIVKKIANYYERL